MIDPLVIIAAQSSALNVMKDGEYCDVYNFQVYEVQPKSPSKYHKFNLYILLLVCY